MTNSVPCCLVRGHRREDAQVVDEAGRAFSKKIVFTATRNYEKSLDIWSCYQGGMSHRKRPMLVTLSSENARKKNHDELCAKPIK